MKKLSQLISKSIIGTVWSRRRDFSHQTDGATAIEYALIASATGLALIASLPAIEAAIGGRYGDFAQWFTDITL